MMAQKIVTMCDAHMATTDDEVPAFAWEVTLLAPGESKPTTWSVDLCRDHAKELLDLADTLNSVGRITEGSRKARRANARATADRQSTPAPKEAHTAPSEPLAAPNGSMVPTPCPVDGCDAVPATRKSLVSHLRHMHDGMTMDQALGRARPYACPEPGCDFASSRPQGLGAHRKAAHGTAGASASAGAS